MWNQSLKSLLIFNMVITFRKVIKNLQLFIKIVPGNAAMKVLVPSLSVMRWQRSFTVSQLSTLSPCHIHASGGYKATITLYMKTGMVCCCHHWETPPWGMLCIHHWSTCQLEVAIKLLLGCSKRWQKVKTSIKKKCNAQFLSKRNGIQLVYIYFNTLSQWPKTSIKPMNTGDLSYFMPVI